MTKIREVEVAVAGGGAAGMAAATAAAQEGASVLLLERDTRLGGVLDQCIHPGFGLHRYKEELTGPEFAFRLQAELEAARVEVALSHTVIKVDPRDPELLAVGPKGLLRVRAKAVVWACGAWERPVGHLLIPGTRPAGIFTAGLAQHLVNIHGLLPGRRVLILGSGDIGLIMARRLHLEGAEVVGVAEIKSFPGGLIRNVRQCLEDYGIPLFLRTTVSEIHGRDRLKGVTLVEVDEQGKILPGTEKFVEVDALVLSVGLIPEVRLLEGFLPLDRAQRGPCVNSFWQAGYPWLFVVGNALVVFDLVDTVAAVGEEAGRFAARFARGGLGGGPLVPVKRGKNVAALVPQAIVPGEPARLFLRVARLFPQARVEISSVYNKVHLGLRPAEMVEIKLPPEATKELQKCGEVAVEVHPL